MELSTTSHQRTRSSSLQAKKGDYARTITLARIPPPDAEVQRLDVMPKVIRSLRKHRRKLYLQLPVGTALNESVAKIICHIVHKESGSMTWPVGLASEAVLFLAVNAHDVDATTGYCYSFVSTVEEVKQIIHSLRGLEHQDKVKQITLKLVAASAVVDYIVRRPRQTDSLACACRLRNPQRNPAKLRKITKGLQESLKYIKSELEEHSVSYCVFAMQERLSKVMKFLRDSGESTRVVGLHGKGGIGKTSLMRAVEANLRDSQDAEGSGTTHKIALVEVGMQRPPGFTDLQQSMYKQLTGGSNQHFSSAAQGRAELKGLFERLKRQGKRICIFLDNVWDCKDLVELLPGRDYLADALPPGSYLLISSRYADVAAKLADICFKTKHEETEGYLDYELPALSENHAKDLFLWKASRGWEEKPLRKDDPLVKAIVPRCGGLPLALAVYGSYFRDERKRKPDTWKRVLKKLERAEDLPSGDDKVFQKLKDSVCFLPERLQDAFVDVALFFCGQSFDYVKLAMVGDDLDRLVDQSLVTRRREWVQVHDLLIAVAKQMAKERNISFVKHDTSEDEIAELLLHPQVLSIRAFDEEGWCRYAEISYPSSAQIQDVRFLKLKAPQQDHQLVKQRREFCLMITQLCHKLRILELQGEDEHRCLIANLKHLRVLSVQLDSFEGISKISSQLRVFKASLYNNCHDFPSSLLEASFTTLQWLQVTGFKDYMLPNWVMKLHRLMKLDFSGSTSLVKLPKELGQLGSLTGLDLSRCTSLVQLPKELGQLGSLTQLDLSGCTNLVQLPKELGQLGSLTQLDLSGCMSLVQLPKELGQLGSLTQLDLSGCTSLVQLPKELGQLGSLTQLDLSGCPSLVQLPKELGQLGSLTRLDLSGCTSLVQLPEEFGQLGSLTKLDLSGCTSLVQLPQELRQLGSLTWLDVSGCTNLVQLPEELGQLGCPTELEWTGHSSELDDTSSSALVCKSSPQHLVIASNVIDNDELEWSRHSSESDHTSSYALAWVDTSTSQHGNYLLILGKYQRASDDIEFFFPTTETMSVCVGVGLDNSKAVLKRKSLQISIIGSASSTSLWEEARKEALHDKKNFVLMRVKRAYQSLPESKPARCVDAREMAKIYGVGFEQEVFKFIVAESTISTEAEQTHPPLLFILADTVLLRVGMPCLHYGPGKRVVGQEGATTTEETEDQTSGSQGHDSERSAHQGGNGDLNVDGGGDSNGDNGGESGDKANGNADGCGGDGGDHDQNGDNDCEGGYKSGHIAGKAKIQKLKIIAYPGAGGVFGNDGVSISGLENSQIEPIFIFDFLKQGKRKTVTIQVNTSFCSPRKDSDDGQLDGNNFEWYHDKVRLYVKAEKGEAALERPKFLNKKFPLKLNLSSTKTQSESTSIQNTHQVGASGSMGIAKLQGHMDLSLSSQEGTNHSLAFGRESNLESACGGFICSNKTSNRYSLEYHLDFPLTNFDTQSALDRVALQAMGLFSYIEPKIKGTWRPLIEKENSPYLFKAKRGFIQGFDTSVCEEQVYTVAFLINHAMTHLKDSTQEDLQPEMLMQGAIEHVLEILPILA